MVTRAMSSGCARVRSADYREGTRSDDRRAGALFIHTVLTALVCTGGRGIGIAIAAASGGSSSGAAW